MTPRYLRVTMYVLAALTIPTTLLLVRWSQSWGIPFSAFYTPGMHPHSAAAFGASVIPATLGMLAVVYGITGLLVRCERSGAVSRHTSFTLVCAGFVASGPLIGVFFVAEGMNPLAWTWNPAVVYPVVLTAAFGNSAYLLHEHMSDPYGHRAQIREAVRRMRAQEKQRAR